MATAYTESVLAQLFKERDYAYILYTMKDKYKVVSAIHKTALDAISGDLYQVAEHYLEEGAEVADFFITISVFRWRLPFQEKKMDGNRNWLSVIPVWDGNL